MSYIPGKIESINQGDHFTNITVMLLDQSRINVKLEKEQLSKIQLGQAYALKLSQRTRVKNDVEEQVWILDDVSDLSEVLTEEQISKSYQVFYVHAPLPMIEIKKGVEAYIKKVQNPVLLDIVKTIYHENKDHFYIHPAATKFHHAYVGGLSYHTLTMLKLAEKFIDVYPYLNGDLLYSGIVLHDMSKINEISGVDGEYTKEGLLLGHLVMQTIEVDRIATLKGYQASEEVLMLKHMILSHHGQLNFGSPKKPQIAEALLLWFIDTIDSKFTVLGESLETIDAGTFTQAINVLDKMRYYKPKL